MGGRLRPLTVGCALYVALAVFVIVEARPGQDLQTRYASGQNVVPVFDGWEANPDGTFSMVFGYFNRNWEEQSDVPIGSKNQIEPGGPDRGQPTHFLPRRNMFVFRVSVPKDFGQNELVWSLTVNGKTEKAYATLRPGYALDNSIIQRNVTNTTPPGIHENRPPSVKLETDPVRAVKVGQPLVLNALVTDDGMLVPRPAPRITQFQEPGYSPAWGLRVSWFVYRGRATDVKFSPAQPKVYPDYVSNSPWTPGWAPPPVPPDGRYKVEATFGAAGSFVIRLLAHDGGLQTTRDISVTVNP